MQAPLIWYWTHGYALDKLPSYPSPNALSRPLPNSHGGIALTKHQLGVLPPYQVIRRAINTPATALGAKPEIPNASGADIKQTTMDLKATLLDRLLDCMVRHEDVNTNQNKKHNKASHTPLLFACV